jgi:GR25 family glycosyltransferase involved in LPS biosynthesis
MELQAIPCLIIHRTRDITRYPSMIDFERKIGRTLQQFEGLSGDFLVKGGFPRKHPHEGESTPGNIGCTASHVEILEALIKSNHQQTVIFEDDVELVGDLQDYFDSVKNLPEPDLLFFGVNEIVEGTPTTDPEIQKVTRFWGTHAVLVGRKAAYAILMTYKKYVDQGFALPADWLYSYAIKEEGLLAYAPVNPVIRQRPGLVSLITGNIRH